MIDHHPPPPTHHPQVNITLGTAGHIDHGKTALTKLLTGCDTDRLPEEKARGMSIELGFAPCVIADRELGIVDVPGHEHFVKTMVAGASGMDGVILVVAADDGIMPQTREHLDILTLLGIQHGLVALTKIDRVEREHAALVASELADLLRGTFLEGAPILPLSNVTGEGFGPFYEALSALVQSIRPRSVEGVFRLPVERAFSLPGFGTVVSGIPVAGQARVGERVVLLPPGMEGRIAGIQAYGRDSETVAAGQCAAINVRAWDHRDVQRGQVLTVGDFFAPADWYACSLQLLKDPRFFLKHGQEVKFHTGTSDVAATVFLLEGERLQAGEQGLVQVRLSAPLVAGPGDRFIIRTLSPVNTIGGGTVIEALAEKLKRSRPEVRRDLIERAAAVSNERDFVEYCIRTAPEAAIADGDVARRAKVPLDRLAPLIEALVAAGRVFTLDSGLRLHAETAARWEERLLDALRAIHQAEPDSPGPPLERLREALPLPEKGDGSLFPTKGSRPLFPAVVDWLVARLRAAGRLVERHHRFALAEHRVATTDAERRDLDRIEALFHEQAFHPPSAEELAAALGLSQEAAARLTRRLVEEGRLVLVAQDLAFHAEAVERARQRLVEALRRDGRFESVDFKYLLDTTRKFALPLLDYFDRIGVTVRAHNTRYLRSDQRSAKDDSSLEPKASAEGEHE
jgi:selenocysteine-specific elongation factor